MKLSLQRACCCSKVMQFVQIYSCTRLILHECGKPDGLAHCQRWFCSECAQDWVVLIDLTSDWVIVHLQRKW